MANTESYYPTVIVPGIGHSRVFAADNAGQTHGYVFPPSFDMRTLAGDAALPLIKLFITKNTDRYIPPFKQALKNAVSPLALTAEGYARMPQTVETFLHPISQCTPEQKRHIYACVPLQSLAKVISEDNLFFFAFNSFGQPFEAAEQLHRYIQLVKRITRKDKVNLVAVSLGGCVSVAYLDAYAHKGDIHRLINFIPAINGSSFAADVVDNRVSFEHPEELFGLFMSAKETEKVVSVIRRMPQKVYTALLQALVDVIREEILLHSGNIWGLVPREQYPALRDRYLTGSRYALLRAKTDRFYRAQCAYEQNVARAQAAGTTFFCIAGHGRRFISLSPSHDIDADGVIDTAYTTGFANVAPLGQRFPDDYKPLATHCSNEAHSHLSPGRTVDLSCCLFPERTWLFDGQFHDEIAYNDVALLITQYILTDESFTCVDSVEGLPQFNGTRNTRHLFHSLFPKYEATELSLLPPSYRDALCEAYAEACEAVKDTLITPQSNERLRIATEKLQKALQSVEALGSK